MTDYKDHPPSVSELRADKSDDASDWTPRDALITALRDIDSGECEPTCLIVVMGHVMENYSNPPDCYVSSPNKYITIGMLSMALQMRIKS